MGPIQVLPAMKLFTFSADYLSSPASTIIPRVSRTECCIFDFLTAMTTIYTENISTTFQHLKLFTLIRPIHLSYNQEDLTSEKLRTVSQFDLEDSFLLRYFFTARTGKYRISSDEISSQLAPHTDPVVLQLVLQHLDHELRLVQLAPHPPVLSSTEISPEQDLTNLQLRVPCLHCLGLMGEFFNRSWHSHWHASDSGMEQLLIIKLSVEPELRVFRRTEKQLSLLAA